MVLDTNTKHLSSDILSSTTKERLTLQQKNYLNEEGNGGDQNLSTLHKLQDPVLEGSSPARFSEPCRLPGRTEILSGLWPLTTGLGTSSLDEQWIYLLVECPNGSSLVVFHRDENRHAVLG